MTEDSSIDIEIPHLIDDEVFTHAQTENFDSPALIDLEKVDTNLLQCLQREAFLSEAPTSAEIKSVFKEKKPLLNTTLPSSSTTHADEESATTNAKLPNRAIEAVQSKELLSSSCQAESSPSLTNSMINLIFDEKDKHEKQKKMDGNESSLSLIDLDALDGDEGIFTEAQKDDNIEPVPSSCEPLHVLANQPELHASPIPFVSDLGPRVTKTPVQNPQISSPFKSPVHDMGHRPFSISSTTASPIHADNFVASTPFHGRIASADVIQSKAAAANTTYNLDEQAADTTSTVHNRTTTKPMNVTYDSKPAALNNATFTTNCDVITNDTFSKPAAADDVTVAKANETFEVVVKSVTDKSVIAPEVSPQNTTYDCGKGNESRSSEVTSSETSAKATKEKSSSLRKPLTSLSNAGNSRIKPAMTSQLQKRSSRLMAPRMNTAAISRMQARSPQKQDSVVQDENASTSMKPPASTTMLRKPKKTLAAPRKSLLPPTSTKTRPVTSPGKKSQTSPKMNQSTSSNHSTSSKRKAESPKHPSRTSKTDTSRSAAPTSSSLRNNGQVTSRISQLRQGSKLQRPQARSVTSSASTTASTRTVTSSNTAASESSIGARSRGTALKQAKSKQIQPSPKEKPVKRVNQTSQCVVAMATLLDYVVNRLDGLSAPKLSSDKQQLQRLVKDQNLSNADLSTRVSNLDEALNESRDAHARDVEEAVTRHHGEVRELQGRLEDEERNFQVRLQELSERLTSQEAEHKRIIEELKEENRKTTEDLEMKHGDTVEQLRLEWSEEREEIEKETLDLRENMNAKVEAKVEELIQPYINSFEENKSLRTVLEMKNSDHHKLQLEISQQNQQLGEVRTLRDQVIGLQQKNEDLQTQVHDKNTEQRQLKNEILQLRRNLDEQQHISTNQQQRIEELHYRLNSSSPSPASPFNPVFTPSPTTHKPSGDPFGANTTPLRTKHMRSLASNSSNKRSQNSDDTPTENGTS